MKKTITMSELKVMLRETGVRVKPSYDYGHSRTIALPLKQEQIDFLNKQKKIHGFKSTFVNQAIKRFNPFKIDIRLNLKTEEAKSTAGFLDKKIGKTFGTRDKIKFTSVSMDKEMFNKIEEMAKYYSISKSAMIRLILDTEMSK